MSNSQYGVFNPHAPVTAQNCIEQKTASGRSFGMVLGGFVGAVVGSVAFGPSGTIPGAIGGGVYGRHKLAEYQEESCKEQFPQLRK